jgi:hypothetical protein
MEPWCLLEVPLSVHDCCLGHLSTKQYKHKQEAAGGFSALTQEP